MTSPTTNLSLQRTPSQGALSRDITKVEDLGVAVLAPDGVMRVPLEYITYVFHTSIILPKCSLPPLTAAQLASGQFFQAFFTAANPNIAILVDGDLVPQVWGREVGAVNLDGISFADISNAGAGHGSHMWDLVGGGGSFSVFAGEVFTHANFKIVGHFVDMGFFQGARSQMNGCETGYVIHTTAGGAATNQSGNINNRRFLQLSGVVDQHGPSMTFTGDLPEIVFVGCQVDLDNSANSAFHIDSASAEGNYNFTGCAFQGVGTSGNFFRPDEVEAITVQINRDLVISSFSDSTADPGVDTSVNFGGIVDFTRGQTILISGATQGSLNGLHVITRVAADQESFDIAVVFVTSNICTLQMVEHTTVNVKFQRNETVAITGTTNYNTAGLPILSRTDAVFILPQAFNGNDATGTATSIGRTQKSVGVNCEANGAQPNSKFIAFGEMNANAVVTVIAAVDTYQALDCTGLADNAMSERFILTNATNGIYTYNGVRPISPKIVVIPSAIKTGATQNYRFTPSINGAIPTFDTVNSVAAGASGSNFESSTAHGYAVGDTVVHTTFTDATYNGTFVVTAIVLSTIYEVAAISFNATGTGLTSVPFAPMEVKTSKVQATVSQFVSLVNGDTIQIMVAGEGHSDNITITDYSIQVEG